MADATIVESTNLTTEPLICVHATITKDDANTPTTLPYFGVVVGFTVIYGTVPAAGWDLHIFDEHFTDLTDTKGLALDGGATDYLLHKVQQFGLTDVGGGTPVWGKITFGEADMVNAGAVANVYLYIMPSIPQRGLFQ